MKAAPVTRVPCILGVALLVALGGCTGADESYSVADVRRAFRHHGIQLVVAMSTDRDGGATWLRPRVSRPGAWGVWVFGNTERAKALAEIDVRGVGDDRGAQALVHYRRANVVLWYFDELPAARVEALKAVLRSLL